MATYGLAMTPRAPTQPAVAPVTEPVRLFSELSSADVRYAGGRGANLGQSIRSEFPVLPRVRRGRARIRRVALRDRTLNAARRTSLNPDPGEGHV